MEGKIKITKVKGKQSFEARMVQHGKKEVV